MSNVFELKQERETALVAAENVIRTAESAHRDLTSQEGRTVDMLMATVKTLNAKIEPLEKVNTMKQQFRSLAGLSDAGRINPNDPNGHQKKVLSREYHEAFFENIRSAGKSVSAALYEGSDGAGGYAVPILVDGQIVPLAPPEAAVRKLATVLPTSSDIKIPQKASFGAVALKSESGGSTNLFTESDPTLSQVTLSAFMIGGSHTVSWEAAQDIPTFQAFAIDDLLLSQVTYEENLFVNGSGTGQPLGLIGNTGAGVTDAVEDANGNRLSIDATFDVLGKLNAIYHPGASWLMSRASSVELRKAQKQANLFEPVFVRVGTQDYLHGYPVEYSGAMPAIAGGATPVLFGDFKRGYVIGDRGGAGINVKILDQPLATAGQLILLAYRRTDGRVRRSEAIQAITLSVSDS